MIEELSKTLRIYVIYMNNFFIFLELFQQFCDHGYEACETAQSNTTDFSSQLLKLHKYHFKVIPHNTLYAKSVNDVLCLAWQDNNLILAMSTIHYPTDFIECE